MKMEMRMNKIILLLLLTACGSTSYGYAHEGSFDMLSKETSGDDLEDFDHLTEKAADICSKQKRKAYVVAGSNNRGVYNITFRCG